MKSQIWTLFWIWKEDHALNWRDAILNPEHARAYLLDFKTIDAKWRPFQLKASIATTEWSISWSDILHQEVDRIRAYSVRHGLLTVVKCLDLVLVPAMSKLWKVLGSGFKKLGLRLERLNRHQDIYQKRFIDPSEQGRWVDLSARILADWQWNNLIISSNINFVNSLNYQWQLHPNSTPEFPRGHNLFSVHAQTSLIYFWNQPKSKND